MRKLGPQEGHDLYKFRMGSGRGTRMTKQSLNSGLLFNPMFAVWYWPAVSSTPGDTCSDASGR